MLNSDVCTELIPNLSLNRVHGYQVESQQLVDDVSGWCKQSRFQWGGNKAFHVASSGWSGLIQHPKGHRLCQDDSWFQVHTKASAINPAQYTIQCSFKWTVAQGLMEISMFYWCTTSLWEKVFQFPVFLQKSSHFFMCVLCFVSNWRSH